MRTSVIGGGSWGSAFALYLGRQKIKTKLWIREPDIFETARKERENKVFLPGFIFPSEVTFHHDLEEALTATDLIFVAVPSQFCRQIYSQMAPFLSRDHILISLTKGIEKKTLMRMSQVMNDVFQSFAQPHIGVLSGPSFSREVAEGHPTALVLASTEIDLSRKIQRLLSSLALRVYTSQDLIGVELAGALKNIIAIAAGISDALAFGFNSRAALVTRGLFEIGRLGSKTGARKETFSGLAGMGDLVLTCTGPLSRNRHVGIELGKGKSLGAIVASMRMVAEGIVTTLSARQLARRENVEMPICEQVYLILYKTKDPQRALADLMSRALRDE